MKWIVLFLGLMIATPSYAVMCINENAPASRSATMSWVEFPSVDTARTIVSSLILSTAENRVYVDGQERNRTVARTYLRCFEDNGDLVLYEIYRVVPNCQKISDMTGNWKCETNLGVRLEIDDILQKLKNAGVRE